MSAAGLIQRRGAAVTCTLTQLGSHTASTDRGGAASAASVAGFFMRTPGDPKEYAALGLTEDESITGHFTPTTAGQIPALGALFTFAGVNYAIRRVHSVAPNGTSQRVRLVASR